MPNCFQVHCTVNGKNTEHDYSVETNSLDETLANIFTVHPNCTSIVMAIVPNKDGVGVIFDKAETGT